MAAIKSLVASSLLALVLVPVSPAGQAAITGQGGAPAFRIDADDQAWAAQTLLKRGDFGSGWSGGIARSSKPTAPSCPGFNPKASDLVVTGQANASFRSPRVGVQISLETQVLESSGAALADFARTIRAGLAGCLAYQLKRDPSVMAVKVAPLAFPKLGSASAAYRATITVRTNGQVAKVLRDFVFFANGRLEYSLRVDASARYSPQLVPFEVDMTKMLLKRGARPE